MRITTDLIKELVKDVEADPGSWIRIGDWLTKKFDHGRIGLKAFGRLPYILELDASAQQKGNLDRLTIYQALVLRRGRIAWLRRKHSGIYKSMVDWHKNPDLPMDKWIKLREDELKISNKDFA